MRKYAYPLTTFFALVPNGCGLDCKWFVNIGLFLLVALDAMTPPVFPLRKERGVEGVCLLPNVVGPPRNVGAFDLIRRTRCFVLFSR